jgi:uncharacterized protein
MCPTSDRQSAIPARRTAGAGGSPRWTLALVTGASSGIGDAFARRLAAEGSDLLLVARDLPRLEALAEELRREHSVGVEVIAADLSAPVARAAVEKRLAESTRPVDLLVNNAGFGTAGDFAELPIGREEQEVQVNVVAVMRLTAAALQQMVPRGSGGVLNVSSIAGEYPSPGSATYAASKAFVTSFTAALHEELSGSGVIATAVLPGLTRTEFHARSGGTAQADAPSAAWLSPDAVARQALDAIAAGRARIVPGRAYRAVSVATAPLTPGARRRLLALSRRLLH